MKLPSMRERILAVYRGHVPERVPVSAYARFLPRGFTERTARNLGLGIIDYHPVVSMLAPPWHTHSGYISEVKGAELKIRFVWDKGQKTEVRTYETPVGTASQHIVRDPVYGSDWISKYYVEELEDYKILQYLTENVVIRQNEVELKSKIENLGEDGIILGRLDRSPYQKLLIELAGPERFLLDLHTTPGPVTELMDVMSLKLDEALDMAVDSVAQVIWQPDNITSDMTPPYSFDEYCVPHYQKRGAIFREAGKPYLVHMDGKLNALKDHIAACVFDSVESFSLPLVGGDLELTDAFEAWPDKVLIPNFPSPLSLEDNLKIGAFLRGLMETVGGERPFMLEVSEDIDPENWQRVLLVLCDFFAKY
jgi:hypothetical protein